MEKIRERDLTWQIEEFMICCKSKDLRRKTMQSYEQTLRLFERWCRESLDICSVDEVSENVIRHYITELQERGKYTYYARNWQKDSYEYIDNERVDNVIEYRINLLC